MDVVERWTRHLRATGRNERTIGCYRSDVEQLRTSIGATDLRALTTRQFDAFLNGALANGLSVSTVTRRYRSAHLFYDWLVSKKEVTESPIASIALPSRESFVDDVLSDAELAALLGACRDENATGRRGRIGRFESYRATAIVLVLATAGLTAAELVGLETADVDLDAGSLRVRSGRGDERSVTIMHVTADAIEKYLAVREHHPDAGVTDALWLGERGAMTQSGVRQVMRRRSEFAGIRHVRMSDLRAKFARDALGRGVSGAVLADLGGWGSARSVDAYRCYLVEAR